jgi:hypothetical protein
MPDPTPIPDEELEAWPGAIRMVIAPPVGFDPLDGPIRAVEAIVDHGTLGRRFSTRWVFKEEEIIRLAAGDPVYLSVAGQSMVPVCLSFLEPVEETPNG